MARLGDDGLDLPFKPQEPTMLPPEDMLISGGMVVAGAVVPIPEHGNRPGLLFRFAKTDGSGFYDPMLLVLEGDQAYAVQDLVKDAVNAALTAVHRADNGGAP